MKINEKFKSLIPPLAPEEYAQLESNIKADGCRDPLVVWDGTLIDGHNRYEICQRNRIQFKTTELDFKDENAASVWIIRNQFGRRNLAPFTRVELANKLEPLLKEAGKEAYAEKVGRPKSLSNLSTNSNTDALFAEAMVEEQESRVRMNNKVVAAEKHNTRKELARLAGVSEGTYAKAKVIIDKADEGTKSKLRQNQESITKVHGKLTGSAHASYNSGENEWYTPVEYITAATAAMMGIDLDPATSEKANKTVKAPKIFTKDDDGLKKKWSGNVWLNPPYAQPLISEFSEKVSKSFEDGDIKQACVLVNNATDTAWFHRMMQSASSVCFTRGRVKFLNPEGFPGAPLQGQAIIYFGKRTEEFKKHFKQFGFVL